MRFLTIDLEVFIFGGIVQAMSNLKVVQPSSPKIDWTKFEKKSWAMQEIVRIRENFVDEKCFPLENLYNFRVLSA